jgi:hypothetical protein
LPGVRGGASVPPSVIAGVIVVRYILLPLLGTALVKGAVRLGLIQPDPLYQFILHLQYAVPPALNIGNIIMHPLRSLVVLFLKILCVLVCSRWGKKTKQKVVASEVGAVSFFQGL